MIRFGGFIMNDPARTFQNIINRRQDFPSLKRTNNGYPLACFAGPGGTQVPQQVIDAVAAYYTTCNANSHGCFITSKESDQILDEARDILAVFLGASSSRNISFGPNMTTLTFALSRAIGRTLQAGDEILITQLDHEANRGPWLALREQGIVVKEVQIKSDATLDYDDFQAKINEKTRLAAVGYSSNAIGTVNDIPLIRELTYKVGAWLLVDAVHYVPHFPIDVTALGLDFLLCSAYKFYGPHVGILYAGNGLLDCLPTYILRTQEQQAPYCIETGTLNHAAIAGVNAAVKYIASLGTGNDLRSMLNTAMRQISAYEDALTREIYTGLADIQGVKIVGPSLESCLRAPTISFTVEGVDPVNVCTLLNEKGICSWDGHFYGIRPIEILGLLEKGGVTRVGVSLYNTSDEGARLVEAVREIAGRNHK